MKTTNTAAAIKATPTKLRSGAWGAKTIGLVEVGEVITITTKSGKSWEATVSHVVWTDGRKTAIVATESAGSKPSARRRGTWSGCSCGSVEEYTKSSDCWSCKHDAD